MSFFFIHAYLLIWEIELFNNSKAVATFQYIFSECFIWCYLLIFFFFAIKKSLNPYNILIIFNKKCQNKSLKIAAFKTIEHRSITKKKNVAPMDFSLLMLIFWAFARAWIMNAPQLKQSLQAMQMHRNAWINNECFIIKMKTDIRFNKIEIQCNDFV